MPLDVVRDEARRWILVRVRGCLTIAEVLTLIRTARADLEHQMWPMLVDANAATTDATEAEVDLAVDAVGEAVLRQGPRGHVAIASEDDRLFARMMRYEAGCAAIGVNVIRVFRHVDDAERWLTIVSAARHF